MSSPSIFVLGVGCILNNWFSGWLCSNLGVTPYLWVAGVVPSFVVYSMCDRRKLKRAASDLGTVVNVLCVGSVAFACVYFTYVPWVYLAMAGCTYFMLIGFSREKTMYMGDRCGAIAKELFRTLISNFISEAARMKMKGDWSFCSPYSRKLVLITTDHYYTLQRTAETREATLPSNQEPFNLNFLIEDCEVFCNYEYLKEYQNGIERRWHPNKVEISLLYVKEPLLEFTYFDVPARQVVQLRRLLGILKDEGNLVLSSFHRNVGSECKVAHARCYEFEEMLELVLKKCWKLKRIDLTAQYDCSVSGSSFPHGTVTCLFVGLACFLISSFWNLSQETSAAVFAMSILLLAPMELDIVGLFKKAQRGGHILLSPILSAELLKLFRASMWTENLCH